MTDKETHLSYAMFFVYAVFLCPEHMYISTSALLMHIYINMNAVSCSEG